jgi:hypothetical protein
VEALQEGLFCNGVQLCRHILYDVLVAVKTEAFLLSLQPQEQLDVTRSHVRNLWNAVVGQETLDQV